MFRMEQTSILNFWLKVGRFIGSQDRMRESVDGRPRWASKRLGVAGGPSRYRPPPGQLRPLSADPSNLRRFMGQIDGFYRAFQMGPGWASKVVAARRVNGVTE